MCLKSENEATMLAQISNIVFFFLSWSNNSYLHSRRFSTFTFYNIILYFMHGKKWNAFVSK